jgi:cytosine/uracil/thiamine/allantoin permease
MSTIAESHLSNKDLAPTGMERRTWGTYHMAALWVGLSIVITTYTLASGLIAAGMTWWQGLLTVSLGNFIVLIPILLNSHPGTKYGIPFPVLVRSSFGIRGANVAAMARALVACGWFGIQTWIGALALDTLMTTLTSGWADVDGQVGYGSLLASFLAVMLVDYWVLRRARLDVEELYRPGPGGRYWYSSGYNWRALVAVAAGVIPVLPGFLHAATTEGGVIADPDFFDELYRYGVFVAFALSAVTYVALTRVQTLEPAPAAAD